MHKLVTIISPKVTRLLEQIRELVAVAGGGECMCVCRLGGGG